MASSVVAHWPQGGWRIPSRGREREENSGKMGVCSARALEVHVRTLLFFFLDKARRATNELKMSEKIRLNSERVTLSVSVEIRVNSSKRFCYYFSICI